MYTIAVISVTLFAIFISTKKRIFERLRGIIRWMLQLFNRCAENNSSSILDIVDLETKDKGEVVVPSEVEQPITQSDALLIDLTEEENIRNPSDSDLQAVKNRDGEKALLDNAAESDVGPSYKNNWRSYNPHDNESSEEVSQRPYHLLETIEVHREDPKTESISEAQEQVDLTKSSENTSEGVDSISNKEDNSHKELTEDKEKLLGEESSQEQENINEHPITKPSAEKNLSKPVREDERPLFRSELMKLLIRTDLDAATFLETERIDSSINTSEFQHHINQQTLTKSSAEESLSKSVEEDERPLLNRFPESALDTASGKITERRELTASTSEFQDHLNEQFVTKPSAEENLSKYVEEDERPLLNRSPETAFDTATGPVTEKVDLSISTSEFQDHLYENVDPKNLKDGKQLPDHQNTASDIPSVILGSDSFVFDELTEADSIQEDKPSESLTEDDSNILSILCERFIEGERRHTEITHILNQGLIEEVTSKSEAVHSSGSREVSFTETEEEVQDLIDREESSEVIVGEEVEEDANIFEEPAEVLNQACSNIFQYNCQNSRLLKDCHIFTSNEEFSKNECLISREQNCNYSFDNLQGFSISQYNNTTDTFLNCISNSENMSMNTLNYSNFQLNLQNKPIKNEYQVRVLTLDDNNFRDSTLYRLKKNYVIEFRLGPSLFGRKISIYCNFPQEKNGNLCDFARDNYRPLEWKQDEGCENSDDSSLYTQICCSIAGSFHFYYIHSESVDKNNICGSGYFLVDPVISYGNNESLPLDCIQCQTVISKHLGSFSGWKDKLIVSRESGYNMIHFTPIQALGLSNSAYSLMDQLQLNPSFKKKSGPMPSWEEIKSFISTIKKEWKVSSICDIVLNHTANESVWIQEHPEVTYNCQNCMYMRPAYLLDAAFNEFSLDVKKGMYETRGIPAIVDCEDHINAIRYHLLEVVLKELKLHELFICDVNKCVSQFLDIARQNRPLDEVNIDAKLTIIQDHEYKRLKSSIDMDLALKIYNRFRPGCFDEDTRVRKCCEEFKQKLDSLNQVIIDNVQDHLNAAVENVINGIRYWRVQTDGPKLKEITLQDPLISRYFTDYGTAKSMKEYEEVMYSDKGKYLMAHNGWVQNGDPLVNFAGPDSTVYIRRELIAWGDSVKLRFGEKPSDCPFLWDHMKKYVERTASIFDGVRLDNCHSTPINVAQYLLDAARKIRPDLYVVAELFTNSDEKDNIFVNKLGISSLIREGMNAWNSHEQGRLVYRFGGVPVGSFYQPNTRPLVSSIAHALFMDLTHDNPSPIEKRSVFDMLPSSALVNMSCCGTGSNRGYDELVPHHISVVDETREYTEWGTKSSNDPKYISDETGIIAAKRELNDLHFKLGKEGFDQVYVDQMDPDVVAVTRHCPNTHQSYVLVAFTAFTHPGENDHKWQRSIKPLVVEGVLDEIVLEATLSHSDFSNGGSKFTKAESFEKSTECINGYLEYKVHMKKNIQLSQSEVFQRTPSANPNEIILNFKNFKPGSVVIIKVSLPKLMAKAVAEVRNVVQQFSSDECTEFKQIVKKLCLSSLNRILYRCDQEERDEGKGFDTYEIPGYGKLVYSGLQGFISLLSKIRPNNDLGHPMCDNLRNGTWMIDYIFQRLKLDEKTADLGKWIEKNTRNLKILPKYLRPAYFDMFFTGIYELLIKHSYNLMSDFVHKGSIFVKALSMGSVQFAAYIKSADLPELSPNLAEPKPDVRSDENGKKIQSCVSLSAGLPHFSVGYTRNWGRDTFIALRGLFILTGRHQEARYHILGYGACLRHGLIPNLLDGGRKSRYNCRDAVWWWLYCIKCYTEDVPNGIKILEDKVSRIFPTDDSLPQKPGETDQILQDVIQEALTRHFQGLVFRERNAGREIDEHMNDNGFNNQIGVHPSTGFIFGGNVDNCGTWMDKMGSSAMAGNKGKPATPRDGSACEIVGLSKCVISWLANLYDQKKYNYSGVERVHPHNIVTKWSFRYWADKIQNNFEKCFWVNEKPTEGETRQDLINKRGIYKDCFGATQEWTDYQLRCNFPIVMVVAPELFNPQHAWIALEKAQNLLLGPLGMKTLDPSDWAYRADYDNSNDSQDKSVANGFNYHQGPEWVWPIGYFLRAKLYFAAKNGKLKQTVAEIKYKLSRHFIELQTSDWRGLPELTNSNGSYCGDSSRTQAWSMSSILEVLYDLQKIDSSIL